jgi:tol-pal system protein YbgF
MRRVARSVAMVASLMGASAPAYGAADKTHQQIMAEIRMLQEQQQQLQSVLGGLAESLAESLKVLTAKLDDQSGSTRKAFADQRLLIESVSETARILREKADDTNVRLSAMTQELETIRQTIGAQAQAQAATVPGQEPPGPPPAPTGPPPAGGVAVPPGVSAQRMYDEAFSDYTRGDYDLAIEGFQTYIRMFPRTDRTDDAQLKIGDSLYAAKRFPEAVTAFQKVISDYPQSDGVPAAYYKLGLTYEALKQPEQARKAFDTVVKNHQGSNEAILAKQRLDVLSRGK